MASSVHTAAANPAQAHEQARSVRLARVDEHDAVASALADAFYDDPVMSWVSPDDSRRLDQLRRLFAFFGQRVWFRHELSFTTEGIVGAAVWMPPGAWHLGFLRELLLMPGMLRRAGLRDFPRLMRLLNLFESHHPHEPHHYLPVIGVTPGWQGKGLGTALLRPMLERCDEEGMPAYLEATSARNRTCYERNGFEATDELVLPDGPPAWTMWRRPSGS